MKDGISYAITVCTEAEELNNLLNFLELVRSKDEVVVLVDNGKVTESVTNVLSKYRNKKNYRFYTTQDFSEWKNKLTKLCTKQWIYQIDADELPTEYQVKILPKLLELNADVDLIWVPRINMVSGITDEDIARWHWVKNIDGRINWPDYQGRLYKNNPKIYWQGVVHEKITGYKKYAYLPLQDEFALIHNKSIDRQRKQNEYYDTLH